MIDWFFGGKPKKRAKQTDPFSLFPKGKMKPIVSIPSGFSMFPKMKPIMPKKRMPQKRYLKQTRGLQTSRFFDFDKDLVINGIDCFPFDKKRHGWRDEQKYWEEKRRFQFPKGKKARPYLRALKRAPWVAEKIEGATFIEDSDKGQESRVIGDNMFAYNKGLHNQSDGSILIRDKAKISQDQFAKIGGTKSRGATLADFYAAEDKSKKFDTSETFYHEAKHEIDRRADPRFNEKYRYWNKRAGYTNNPYEIRARKYAEEQKNKITNLHPQRKDEIYEKRQMREVNRRLAKDEYEVDDDQYYDDLDEQEWRERNIKVLEKNPDYPGEESFKQLQDRDDDNIMDVAESDKDVSYKLEHQRKNKNKENIK